MQFWSLKGSESYSQVRELQSRLVDLRARDEIEDTVLFLEHSAVVTQGRGLQFTGTARPRHMPVPLHLPAGFAFSESERGGDLTYHGPGQLVVYPIIKLDGKGFGPLRDIGLFLRKFEQVFIDEIEALSGGVLCAEARENATGVWVKKDSLPFGGYKVASIGIAIRKWVTYHGLAINCVNDLKPFHLISPCGFAPEVMSRMVDLFSEHSVGGGLMRHWHEDGRSTFERRIAERMLGDARDHFLVRSIELNEAFELTGA